MTRTTGEAGRVLKAALRRQFNLKKQVLSGKLKPDGLSDFIKEMAPIVTSIAAVLVSIFVYNISARQSRFIEADLRAKAIQVLYTKDDAQREIAAVTVAEYGLDMLPGLRAVLGASISDIRKGGILATTEMFSRASASEQEKILSKLLDYVEHGASYTVAGATGVFAILAERGQLTSHQFGRVLSCVEKYINTIQDQTRLDKQEAMLGVVNLLHTITRDARERPNRIWAVKLLLTSAESSADTSVRKNALDNLGPDQMKVPELNLTPGEREDLVNRLRKLTLLYEVKTDAQGALHNFE